MPSMEVALLLDAAPAHGDPVRNRTQWPAPPRGRMVRLPGRGRIFVRELGGPKGAPAVVLLHGWMASGGLNWIEAFRPLAQHFRVLAPDLRGHGRGSRRTSGRFSLEGCADDVAALVRTLDAGPAIVAGYSMGGPVAQLLWRRHRADVAGLVLVATSAMPVPEGAARPVMDRMMRSMATATRFTDRATWLPRRLIQEVSPRRTRADHLQGWARQEFGRHHWPTVLDAGRALASYDATEWIGRVDVPTAVLLTKQDQAIPASDQHEMARRIRGAVTIPMNAGHFVATEPAFGATLLAACRQVSARQTDTIAA